MTTLVQRRERLEARLKDLEARREAIEEELNSPEPSDGGEQAGERLDDEVQMDLGVIEAQEIRMIRAALDRMDAGEYGYCVECGAKISEERLTTLPATPFCAKCAAKHT